MIKIMDFHARLPLSPGAADRLLASMDTHRIDRAVVTIGGVIDPDLLSAQVINGGYVETDADNDALQVACEESAGRLVPFFFGNPHRDPDDYADRAAKFRGLEISPAVHGVGLTDRRTTALVAVAAEFGHPVYVVCLGRPEAGVGELAELARTFPSVTFVLGHCGFVGIDLYALNMVAPEPNIVAETSGCYTGVAAAAVARLGADRVLFGTDYPMQHPSVELAKLRALALTSADQHKIVWSNARLLLGEDPS
ncbi:MAG TPA: amidohydrolase family protein [Streptosporangiaceae bacterium]|jgi:predicted TIM-barrel fold metal-dependent hydrolase|nr:amidohydrolase family protein [Streptosporangiaceae bacterium]